MLKNGDKYFAAKSGEDTARIVLSKANAWFHNLDVNGYLDKIKSAWYAYHGAYYTDVGSGHRITFSGEQDELVNLPVNHYRNICRHMLTMVTANRPAMDARSVNTDYKSLVQTKLANGLLDYYMREKRMEDYFYRAVEHAIVFGSGFIKMDWNATSGEIYDMIEPEYETESVEDPVTGEISDQNKTDKDGNPIKTSEGFPIYEGDVKFSSVSPFDVVFDSTKEDPTQHDWVLVRTFKNKYDLAAKYPENEDAILKLETKSDKERYNFTGSYYDQTDDVSVYEFFHKKTESVPNGRYLLFVESNIVLMDSPMPYRKLPVYRIAAGDILGTPYGYTDTFDLLPIQEALNSLYSTVLTNQNAFGVQNVLLPRGTDIAPSSIAGAMNLIEYNAQMGKPESLNLTSTPPEIFNFMTILEKSMETISGINSVTRGNPEASLKSGNALALVQSMSLQFISGLQQSYIKLIEDVGSGLINMLQDFATVPRVAAIVGKANRTYMQEFTGKDLDTINRIVVDAGNPLSKTTAGRVQMAEQMMQMGVITDPMQYINVINTGNLDTMTDGVDRTLLLVKAENEKLINGEQIQAVATERHSIHIKEHQDVLSDPDLKQDQALVSKVLEHIQDHINLLRTTDPDLLKLIGEQPLAPIGGSPANQPMPPAPVNTGAQAQGKVAPQMAAPAGQQPKVPQPAKPPGVFKTLPTNPANLPTQG